MSLTYRSFISSPSWRQSRAKLKELKAARYRCRLCNAGKAAQLEVHHRTYARLGHERVSDLTALCRECHRLVTNHQRRKRYACRRPAVVNVRFLLDRKLVDSNAEDP